MSSDDKAFRDYGIEEYVPMEGRHYGFFDMVNTWIGANANTASWFVGGVIAALGFGGAVAVTLIANPIAYILLALVGYMGYKVATTSMGLVRVPFGINGSKLPSILNSTQFIGWCGVNTFVAAISMSMLAQQIFGWPAYGEPGCWWVLALGVLINSILSILVVVIGGSRSIKYAENIAVIGLVFLTVWITVVVLRSYPLSELLAWRPSQDLALPFGEAIDAMAAFSLSWVPAIAEFTRYTKNKAAATVAPMIGATFSLVWFALVGALGVIAVAVGSGTFDPNMSDPSSIAGALGLGWVAFVVLILTTITTNMINIYAGSMSVINISPKADMQKTLLTMGILAGVISLIPIVLGSFLDAFSGFLGYLGAVFPSLVAIMVVDYYLVRKQKYQHDQLGKVDGPYWYKNGYNWYGVGCWLVGAVVFFLSQKIGFIQNTIGAVFFTFAVTAVLYWIMASIGIKRGAYRDLTESVDA